MILRRHLFSLLFLLAATAHAEWQTVAPGVDYQEYAQSNYDIHVVRIDLTNDQVQVISTRETERGKKVSDFAKAEKAIAAINADYFDAKFNPVGLTIGPCGQWAGTKDTTREGVVAIGEGKATIARQSAVMDPPEEWVQTAVSGWPALISNCEVIDPLPGSQAFTGSPHPRTAVAASSDGTLLYLIVADGRRTGVPGLTLAQLAFFISTRLHACSAINLDGGGSSAMWLGDRVVNRPSDGVERPVGDHLAVVLRSDLVACEDAKPTVVVTKVRPSPKPMVIKKTLRTSTGSSIAVAPAKPSDATTTSQTTSTTVATVVTTVVPATSTTTTNATTSTTPPP